MKTKAIQGSIFFLLSALVLSACQDSYPESPVSPETQEETLAYWADVIAEDENYPENVYLTKNITFRPGKVGSARITDSSEYYDQDGYPYDKTKNGACGPPEGSIYKDSNPDADMTVLGSGGEAVWQFNPDWVIVNKEGNDFVLFSNHNIFNGSPNSSWNELAHVYVSEDNITWYKSSKESYTQNTSPGETNNGYIYSDVVDLFGNNHSWANFRKDVAVQYLNEKTGVYEDLLDSSGNQVFVSKYFKPKDSNLGGDYFDLSNFIKVDNPLQSWPENGKMRYLKLVDDPQILDGQDYYPAWMVGARLMSAMGINVEKEE